MTHGKKITIAGNWKSNKSEQDVLDWFKQTSFLVKESEIDFSQLEIVVFVPFLYLSIAKKIIGDFNLPFSIGAQSISPYPSGAYTGEITGEMITQYAKYVLIGHSERRKFFGETDDILQKKVEESLKNRLEPLYCIQNEETIIPKEVEFVAYEPIWAIGSGTADSPENADKVAEAIKRKWGVKRVLYGGSVTPQNVASFIDMPSLDGVLPGKISLDAQLFMELIQNASQA